MRRQRSVYIEVASMPAGKRAATVRGKTPAPLPKAKLFGCMLVMLTVSFQINVIWPFLPFMVDHVRGVQPDDGFFVGTLASSYFGAQFASVHTHAHKC